MKIYKRFLAAILLLCILTLGAVSASDNLTADDMSSVNPIDETSPYIIGGGKFK